MQPVISTLLEAEDAYRREHVTEEFRRAGGRAHTADRRGTSRLPGRRWHRHDAGTS